MPQEMGVPEWSPMTFLPVMPLKSFHASLPKEGRIDYDTLEQLAREGKLAGTYKQGRNWWLNLLAHMGFGMTTNNNDEDHNEEKETAQAREGLGKCDPEGKALLRENPRKRRGRPPKRTLRVPRDGRKPA